MECTNLHWNAASDRSFSTCSRSAKSLYESSSFAIRGCCLSSPALLSRRGSAIAVGQPLWLAIIRLGPSGSASIIEFL